MKYVYSYLLIIKFLLNLLNFIYKFNHLIIINNFINVFIYMNP